MIYRGSHFPRGVFVSCLKSRVRAQSRESGPVSDQSFHFKTRSSIKKHEPTNVLPLSAFYTSSNSPPTTGELWWNRCCSGKMLSRNCSTCFFPRRYRREAPISTRAKSSGAVDKIGHRSSSVRLPAESPTCKHQDVFVDSLSISAC